MENKFFFFFLFSVVCYLSKANKSPEKFIIAVYLDRRNQHYVKRLRAQRVEGWNGKQINQQGGKQHCLSLISTFVPSTSLLIFLLLL